MSQRKSESPSPERRGNLRLRELIEEMMATIRAAVNRELWTVEERASYEADMARIMSTVREKALDRGRIPRDRAD